MIRYIIRRILWAMVLFLAVTIVTYVIFFVIPVDPAQQACRQAATPDQIAKAAHRLGTDRPWYVQYGKFLERLVVHQSLGDVVREPAERERHRRLGAAPVTASLVFGGAILWMLIALPLGILSALRPRSLLDRGAMIFVLVGISAHPVWIGLIFAYFFGYKLGWFPITGYCDMINPPLGQPGGPVQWAYHLSCPGRRSRSCSPRSTCG